MRGMIFAVPLDILMFGSGIIGSGMALLVCLGLPVGRDITLRFWSGLAVGF